LEGRGRRLTEDEQRSKYDQNNAGCLGTGWILMIEEEMAD
jgi:hypothetical protein